MKLNKTLRQLCIFILLLSCNALFAQSPNVVATKSATSVEIGNKYIKREFSFENNKLKTTKITNLRTDGQSTLLIPGSESQEFVINPRVMPKASNLKPLDKTSWTIEASSWSNQEAAPSGPAQAFIDGNVDSWWHTNYGTGGGGQEMPHSVTIDLKKVEKFKSFTYTPRQQGVQINGNVADYELYVSNTNQFSNTPALKGTFKYDDVNPITVNFKTEQSGQYVKFVALKSVNGQKFAAGAEFDLNELALPEKEKDSSVPVAYKKNGWTIEGNSVTSQENAPYSHLIDGDNSTFWHSNYGQGEGTKQPPFFVIVDMKESKKINAFGYVARPAGINGTAKEYELYFSNDKNNFGTAVKKGTFSLSAGQEGIVSLAKEVNARYVKFVIISSQSETAQQFGSGAELNVYADVYNAPKTSINTSDMTLKSTKVTDIKDGKMVTFAFEPYVFNDITWNVTMKVEMKNGDHFMRKYLEISVPENQQKIAAIDYIDTEYLQTNSGDATWTHPEQGGGVGGMNGYLITTGQPLYMQAMFFGSEFPNTENSIQDKIGHIRYFSGKSFDMFANEGRLKDGKFTTWKSVAGAARSTDMSVLQSDFFEYIKTISTPSDFRVQYNSWYDWMLNIDENNIVSSFWEVEKGFTQNGLKPMDSYVVDDGWNAYGPWKDANTTGFWQFNKKFPNGLTQPSEISRKLSSNFGLWLGPRGGYNYYSEFARFLEANGNGEYHNATQDIVVNHKKYLQKLEEFFLDCGDKYQINYWKWDGYTTVPIMNKKSDQYISGGEQGMYYMTEQWERWIDIMEHVRAKREQQGAKDMWLSLTCYVNPSPWYLQWANSIWIQNSQDIGRFDTGRKRQLDQLLSYRDGRYFDFYLTREFQFPAANIYNHDPIYGKTGTNLAGQMTDDEFRTYLMMMATRGTAFWELYYSYTMMNEGQKWLINAEAVNWIEKNYHLLKNSKVIGTTPEKSGIYGFSCWDGNEGIVSLRNSSTQTKSYTLTLDRLIGLKEGAKNLHRVTELIFLGTNKDDNSSTFNYGQSINITMKPGEVRIWHFSPNADTTPAKIETIKSLANNKISVKFNERVNVEKAKFLVNNLAVKSAKILADYKTVELTLGQNLDNYSNFSVACSEVVDFSNNKTNETVQGVYYPESVIAEVNKISDLNEVNNVFDANGMISFDGKTATPTMKNSISGISDFNIALTLKTNQKSGIFFTQGNDISLALNDGKVVFKVKNLTLTSKAIVSNGEEQTISVCREKNGMLKIYVGEDLDVSLYNKNIINENISKGQITLGSKGFAGELGGVKVTDYAYPFNKIFAAIKRASLPKFSDEKSTHWYKIHDNNPAANTMYIGEKGGEKKRLLYKRDTKSDDNTALFKFVKKSKDSEEFYIYSKTDETTPIGVKTPASNNIIGIGNYSNNSWKFVESKSPKAWCIQGVGISGNNLLNSFNNSADGGIVGFWNDDNSGDPGSQWIFKEVSPTNVKLVEASELGLYTHNRRILSSNPTAQLKIFNTNGQLQNSNQEFGLGVYLVSVVGMEGVAKVLVK